MDELSRIEHVELGSLWLALKGVFSEPSPFTPGEIVFLYGVKKVFSNFLPLELWLRSFALLQGLLALWLSFKSRTPYLWFFTLFSASLTSHSTQARPYSALFLAGTFLYLTMFERTVFTRSELWLMRVQTFFTHVYGLLFLLVAQLFRKDRLWAGITFVYSVAFTATYMKFHSGEFSGWSSNLLLPPLGEFVRQTAGVLGNPHKASFLFLPLFLVGIVASIRTNRSNLGRILLYFGLTVGGPVAALVVGKYAYFPRQVVAATTGFLAICALGLLFIIDQARHNRKALPITSLVILLTAWFAGARPWVRSTVFKMPPFPDVAFHQYRDVVATFGPQSNSGDNILIIDGAGTYQFYLKRIYGPASNTEHDVMFKQLKLRRDCWKNHFCVLTYYDSNLTWTTDFSNPPQLIQDLINAPEFGFIKVVGPWVDYRPNNPSVKMLRDW